MAKHKKFNQFMKLYIHSSLNQNDYPGRVQESIKSLQMINDYLQLKKVH